MINLDTHVFLWLITGNSRLPSRFRDEIVDPNKVICLSVASIWECVIKAQSGRLRLPSPVAEYLESQADAHLVHSLQIDGRDIQALEQLPAIHRDPFDRVIVAQAIHRGMKLATVDKQIAEYDVDLL
jgi:PIN domain nuclease of toxin-antitoxin system